MQRCRSRVAVLVVWVGTQNGSRRICRTKQPDLVPLLELRAVEPTREVVAYDEYRDRDLGVAVAVLFKGELHDASPVADVVQRAVHASPPGNDDRTRLDPYTVRCSVKHRQNVVDGNFPRAAIGLRAEGYHTRRSNSQRSGHLDNTHGFKAWKDR